jgi:hypothetical protein
MLKWTDKAQLTDTDVTAAADAVVKLDLPEAKFMMKLSCKTWQADAYAFDGTHQLESPTLIQS